MKIWVTFLCLATGIGLASSTNYTYDIWAYTPWWGRNRWETRKGFISLQVKNDPDFTVNPKKYRLWGDDVTLRNHQRYKFQTELDYKIEDIYRFWVLWEPVNKPKNEREAFYRRTLDPAPVDTLDVVPTYIEDEAARENATRRMRVFPIYDPKNLNLVGEAYDIY